MWRGPFFCEKKTHNSGKSVSRIGRSFAAVPIMKNVRVGLKRGSAFEPGKRSVLPLPSNVIRRLGLVVDSLLARCLSIPDNTI